MLCPTAIICTMVQKTDLPDELFIHHVPALSLIRALRKRQSYEEAILTGCKDYNLYYMDS